jgi:putative endonuclease
MSDTRHGLGKQGEEIARHYLQTIGYRILEQNYQCPLGEIDLIAEDGETIAFIEVKTRTSHRYGLPQLAVGWKKQMKLKQLAWYYLVHQQRMKSPCRFDVIAITFSRGEGTPTIELIQNAFQVEAD